MKLSTNNFFLLLILGVFSLMSATKVYAQGTTGSTITFDSHNSTMLFSNLSTSQTDKQTYSCYIRHNQAPIQIINANPNANNNTIAPLQSAPGTGTGFFANNSLANNMAYATGGDYGVEFYNYASNYNAACFAVIAPKGYRFTEYYMDISSNEYANAKISGRNSKGATIMRYTYNAGSTYQFTVCNGESMTLSSSGSDSEIFSHTLSKAENILYFKIQYTSTAGWGTHMNKLQFKYVIDEEFVATVPNSNGTKVHTGYINLGNLSSHTSGGDYFFDKANVTDLEDVNIVAASGTPQIAANSNAIFTSEGGDYWIESPAKFRIIGATLNFKKGTYTPSSSGETTYTSTTTIENGKTYLITNGASGSSTRYLNVTTSGGLGQGSAQSSATRWIFTASGDGWYIYSPSAGKYLSYSENTFHLDDNPCLWSYTSSRWLSYTNPTNNRVYSLRYNNNWAMVRTDNGNNSGTALSFYRVDTPTEGTITVGNYTATVYGADGTTAAGTATIDDTNLTGSVTLSDLNNDGIKFNVSGAAAFTVDLTLEPLDPTLENLEFEYLLSTGAESGDLLSTSSTNFSFNGGETIVLPVVPEVNDAEEDITPAAHKVVFRHATNNSRIDWYTGTATGFSNYHLIGSDCDLNNPFTQAPDYRVNADQAGTNEVEFSNIKTLTSQGGRLTEKTYTTGAAGTNQFNRTSAGFGEITLTDNGAAQTVYIYNLDLPVNCIMTEAGKNMNIHQAVTFYDATLQTQRITVVPVVAVTPIYTETLKGDNVKAPIYNSELSKNVTVAKDADIDTSHKFYGVKVTAWDPDLGFLSSSSVKDAIKEAMATKDGIYEGDVMRTILYVDMSELKSVSGGAETWKELMLGTADNCMFFMPASFNIEQEMPGGGIVAGGNNGVAVTDIVINDQQPFYTPYSFRTSTREARYSRKVSITTDGNNKNVKNMSLVLPFNLRLSDGHPRTSGDNVNEQVTFYNFGSTLINQNNDKIYDITANIASAAVAEAGVGYYVQLGNAVSEDVLFEVSANGVTFPVTSTLAEKTDETKDGSFRAHGNFNGVAIPKAQGIFYFSKNYFWNSNTLDEGKTVKMYPYRAYYTSTDPNSAKYACLGVVIDENTTVDALDALEQGNEPLSGAIYDLQGRKVASSADQLSTLSRGIYVVHGKKFIIK